MVHLILLFRALWNANDRPEARRFTIGCFLVLVYFIALFSITTPMWRADASIGALPGQDMCVRVKPLLELV
jgi:hypothetical protein